LLWRRALAPVLAALAIMGAACASSGPPGTQPATSSAARVSYPVRLDTSDGEVTIAHRPQRIVSLSPSATQMLYAIGAGSQVVAVDTYSTYPASAPRTNLSGFQPNIEAIASYRPDLVLNDSDTGGLVRSLGVLHVPVLILPAAKDLPETYAQIDELGHATDHLAGAGAAVSGMRSRIAAIVASVPKPAEPLRVYHELDPTYYSATSATFVGEIYKMFGLSNIADRAGLTKNSGYPQLSGEYVVSADPQLIVLADTVCCHQSAATVASRPGWGGIAAVRRGLVVPVDDGLASEWGPRIVDFVAIVAQEVKRAERVYPPASP
jgi:iron complex transport system substrate-binding protein